LAPQPLGLGLLQNLPPSIPLQRQPNWSPLEVQSGRISGGFSTFSFLQGRVVSPTPNPHPGRPGLCIYIPQRQGGPVVPPPAPGTHFSRLTLRNFTCLPDVRTWNSWRGNVCTYWSYSRFISVPPD
jgi:hypothetical protein